MEGVWGKGGPGHSETAFIICVFSSKGTLQQTSWLRTLNMMWHEVLGGGGK